MDARTVPPSAGWLGKAHSPLVVWVDILPSELAAGPPAAFFCPQIAATPISWRAAVNFSSVGSNAK